MTTRLELFRKRKDLPEQYKLLIDWCAWINWDMLTSISLELFVEYEVMMDWLRDELHEWFDVYEDLSIEINQDNYMSFWFEFDSKFNKDSILDMEPGVKYEIKKRYGGYTMIELKSVDTLN